MRIKLLFYTLYFLLPGIVLRAQAVLPASVELSQLEKKNHLKHLLLKTNSNTANYDLTYAQCNWEIDPAKNYIKGHIHYAFKITASPFSQIEFDLSKNLKVDSVIYHHTSVSFTHQTDDVLKIPLLTTNPAGSIDSIRIYYQGAPASSGLGSFIQTTHNNTPVIWTLSEPYGAKDWWPCKQVLADKIDSIDIIVSNPDKYICASNGLLIQQTSSAGITRAHWKSRYPIATYLVAIAVTNYAVYSDYVPQSSGPLQVINYVYPEVLSYAQTQTPGIINIIKLFDSLTIDYPFSKEKYGHAQFSWGGGMEHQTMSFMANYSHVLMAHECAHQWFGDHVTCGSWHDIWLNEGFATYFEGLTEERYYPDIWQGWKQGHLNYIISEDSGSVYCRDTTNVGRIFNGRLTYSKGAYVLHMLRWVLGDKAFFQSLKNYLNDPLLAQSYARTKDLQRHLELVSGKDLTEFFDHWVYKEGYPSYRAEWIQKNDKVEIQLFQTTAHPSVSFFKMPVPLKLSGQYKDTTVIVQHQFSGQKYTFDINFPIVQLEIDPELNILSARNTVFNLNNKTDNLLIHPNPATDMLYITVTNNANYIEQYEITDALGKTIYSSPVFPNLQKTLNLSIDNLSRGMYYISFRLKSGPCKKKFIKN